MLVNGTKIREFLVQREREGEMEAGAHREEGRKKEAFHVMHKVPVGDSPYVRAKHLQLVEKDLDASIAWFWKAINAGDRVDSALKDMAVVMKQQDRAEEAVEAIKSFRHLCSATSQEPIDNILIDLYQKCGMIKELIHLMKQKLWKIYRGEAFNGKTTKTARSHGKKFQVSIKHETSRLLGNLGWAYMQQENCLAAEAVYRKAQMVDPDANKACNLGLCLIRQGRQEEARQVLVAIVGGRLCGDTKTMKRAQELLHEIEMNMRLEEEMEMEERMELLVSGWEPFSSRRLPIFEEISSFRDQMAC